MVLTASCHCVAVSVEVPRKPRSLTNCNCSMCRRYGVLWAYYRDAELRLVAAPDATDEYSWGPKSQSFIRCKSCGCVMQWKKFNVGHGTWIGVNARNFDPAVIGSVRIRLLDGADSWKHIG